MRIAASYTAFALIAIAANIASQDLAIRAYRGAPALPVSVLVGTGVGLVVKYELDKRHIFRYRARGIVHDTRTFVLYTVMGIVTTAIFRGFEFGFEFLFHAKLLRYTGGVIGLGYWMKYHLDRSFVFREDRA